MAAAEAAIVGTYQTRCILKASAGFCHVCDAYFDKLGN
jgi:hypothetical protein